MNASSNELTLRVLRLVGSPFQEDPTRLGAIDAVSLFRFAVKNRIQLLCLDSLLKSRMCDSLDSTHAELMGRYKRTLTALSEASRLLRKSGIDHAFFKSTRPYKEVTVDLDILIFGDSYEAAVNFLSGEAFTLLEEGPMSTTFCDETVPLNLDLYKEVAVSRFVYLDKDRLQRFTRIQKLEDGTEIRSLDDKADLLAVMTHSIIKEQLYVLSEYFTTLGCLNRMSASELDAFADLAKDCHVEYAAWAHLNMTALLHQHAHGFVPLTMKRIIENLGPARHDYDPKPLTTSPEMPYRYGTATVVRAVLEKLRESKAKHSMIHQLKGVLDPRFNGEFFRAALQHMVRQTY